jgi:hypothetical protein
MTAWKNCPERRAGRPSDRKEETGLSALCSKQGARYRGFTSLRQVGRPKPTVSSHSTTARSDIFSHRLSRETKALRVVEKKQTAGLTSTTWLSDVKSTSKGAGPTILRSFFLIITLSAFVPHI